MNLLYAFFLFPRSITPLNDIYVLTINIMFNFLVDFS